VVTTGTSALVATADAVANRFLASHRTRLGGSHIDHARRVAAGLGDDDEHVIAAALLHDVVEKTDIGVAGLQALVADEIVVALVATLTAGEDESERDYLLRCANDPAALRIKRLDLADKLTTDDVHVRANVADMLRDEALRKLHLLDSLAANGGRGGRGRLDRTELTDAPIGR
jgi:(p)ppGpp synthase/HD superfamily hydrolase